MRESIEHRGQQVEQSQANRREPREIDAAFEKHETYWLGPKGRGQPKVALHFRVMTQGPDHGERITAFYRVHRIDGSNRCFAGERADIQRDLGRLFPDYKVKRSASLPLTRLRGVAVRARTTWVTTDRRNRPLPEQQCYERIDWILERLNQ